MLKRPSPGGAGKRRFLLAGRNVGRPGGPACPVFLGQGFMGLRYLRAFSSFHS
jgi:hypothetical protein